MDVLGKLEIDALQFIDLSSEELESNKSFTSMLKRCEQMEIKTNHFYTYAEKFEQKIYKYTDYQKFIFDLENDISNKEISLSSYFDVIESEIFDNERHILELIDSYQKIKEDLLIELEKKLVFEKFYEMTGGAFGSFNFQESGNPGTLQTFMGVIRAEDEIKMNRMVLRSSRGRAIATFFELVYPPEITFQFTKNYKDDKKIYIIIFPSEAKEYLLKKMLQICDLLSGSHYLQPEFQTKEEVLHDLDNLINDKREYLIQAEGSIKKYLKDFAGTEEKPARIDLLRLYAKKEKIVYENLNKCIHRENFIDGEVWVLEDKKDLLISLLNSGVSKDETKALGNFIEVNENTLKRPTYITTNDFTFAFQQIVNTYGIPRYREINPAVFNIVTFPFLFGVMFGDIGHGIIIFLFALYLLMYNKNINVKEGHSSLKFLSKFRYFLLLLSICSIYCGLLYNEFMSVPISLHDTCYEYNNNYTNIQKKQGCVYTFGMDTKWFIAENELTFFNSFKMKFSVIIGVLHMMVGIFLKGLNDNYFKNYYGIIFEFIPQFIFMTILFVYMIVLIFIKWSTFYEDTSKAPSIISQLINIVIKGGSVDNLPLWGTCEEGKKCTEEKFHNFILAFAVILIPIMILPKPFLDYLKYKKEKDMKIFQALNRHNDINNIDDAGSGGGSVHEEIKLSQINVKDTETDKSFIDFFIGQMIFSIEFILGTVSNTASYLRLWALSLAHAELSKVFFEKTLGQNISDGDYMFGVGFLSMFIGYFVLANMTLFVLIGMDFMECFLHTLRLHWVEFQNKFYYADGYLFQPYTFRKIIDGEED